MRRLWKSTELGSDYARDWSGGFAEEYGPQRPTVLLESDDRSEALALWQALESQGYRMEWCPGPNRDRTRRCTLTSSGHCEILERADVVVSHLDLTCKAARETVAAVAHRSTRAPVLVSAPTFIRARYPEITEGTTVIPDHLTGHRVISAVNDALGVVSPPQD